MTTSVSNDLYSSLGLTGQTSTSTKKKDSLDQADFLKLMTTQLQHQDPLKPMDNSQMVAQMAQLSTVQGISDLNSTVESFQTAMSNDQILKGAGLVGHDVLVPSAKLALEAEGGTAAGEVSFEWDGTDADGKRMPAGSYSITASHTDSSGTNTKLSTYVQAEVESVTVGTDGLYLNLKGLGSAPLAYVLRVS